MKVLTVCNSRVDEYMEAAMAQFSETDLEQVKIIVEELCAADQCEGSNAQKRPFEGPVHADYRDEKLPPLPTTNENELSKTDPIHAEADEKHAVSSLVSFRAIIGGYIREMLAHPNILRASSTDRARLRFSLRTFLLAHVAQTEDNSRFLHQRARDTATASVFTASRNSFYTWAHSTGADSVSCPFSFAFLTCLISAFSATSHTKLPTSDCFGSVRQKYLAEDLYSHLAVMSRLYNDTGSLKRDWLEANVNSINFPEFYSCIDDGSPHATNERDLKETLLGLAEYERGCVDVALTRLLSDLKQDPVQATSKRQAQTVNAV